MLDGPQLRGAPLASTADAAYQAASAVEKPPSLTTYQRSSRGAARPGAPNTHGGALLRPAPEDEAEAADGAVPRTRPRPPESRRGLQLAGARAERSLARLMTFSIQLKIENQPKTT